MNREIISLQAEKTTKCVYSELLFLLRNLRSFPGLLGQDGTYFENLV